MNRTVAAIIAACVGLAGCNTISGLGKDMTAIGNQLSKSANAAATGKAKPIARNTTACLPMSNGRVPTSACGPVKTASKTTLAKAKAKPVKTAAKASPVKAAGKPALAAAQNPR